MSNKCNVLGEWSKNDYYIATFEEKAVRYAHELRLWHDNNEKCWTF